MRTETSKSGSPAFLGLFLLTAMGVFLLIAAFWEKDKGTLVQMILAGIGALIWAGCLIRLYVKNKREKKQKTEQMILGLNLSKN